jgi:hypothetical protein
VAQYVIEWKTDADGPTQRTRTFSEQSVAYAFKLKMDDAWPGREHQVVEIGAPAAAPRVSSREKQRARNSRRFVPSKHTGGHDT